MGPPRRRGRFLAFLRRRVGVLLLQRSHVCQGVESDGWMIVASSQRNQRPWRYPTCVCMFESLRSAVCCGHTQYRLRLTFRGSGLKDTSKFSEESLSFLGAWFGHGPRGTHSTHTTPLMFKIQRRNTIKPEITRVRDHRRDVQIIQGGSKRRESVLYTSERGHADASSRGNGNHQNDFCRRASVLALRIAASSSAASSMASSSDATAPTQAESGAQLRRRRLYFCSLAAARSILLSTRSRAYTNGKSNRGRSSRELNRGRGSAGDFAKLHCLIFICGMAVLGRGQE